MRSKEDEEKLAEANKITSVIPAPDFDSSSYRYNRWEDQITITPDSYKSVLERILKYEHSLYIKKPEPVKAYKLHHPFEVETPEGWVYGKPGDYLVVNDDDSMYPADADTFERLYIRYIASDEHEPI